MDLKTYASERGRQTSIARLIDAQPQLVWQWANGVKPVPADRCPAIERASDGAVTCEELRADVHWARVPDASWPHPLGRPTIDVAAPAQQTAAAAAGTTSQPAEHPVARAKLTFSRFDKRDNRHREGRGRGGRNA